MLRARRVHFKHRRQRAHPGRPGALDVAKHRLMRTGRPPRRQRHRRQQWLAHASRLSQDPHERSVRPWQCALRNLPLAAQPRRCSSSTLRTSRTAARYVCVRSDRRLTPAGLASAYAARMQGTKSRRRSTPSPIRACRSGRRAVRVRLIELLPMPRRRVRHLRAAEPGRLQPDEPARRRAEQRDGLHDAVVDNAVRSAHCGQLRCVDELVRRLGRLSAG